MKNPCKGCEDKYRSCEDYCPKLKELRTKKREHKEDKNETLPASRGAQQDRP